MRTGDVILIKTERFPHALRMGTVTEIEHDIMRDEWFIRLDDRRGKVYESDVLGPIHYIGR